MSRKPQRLGIALIVSGPSGTGKSSVCSEIRKRKQNIHFSVSCTTRPPRPGETDGADYYFISDAEFREKIAADSFLEYAEVHGHRYGTLESEVLAHVKKGVDVLLDIDVQGAMLIRKYSRSSPILAHALEFVFIGPPNFAELEKRLRTRATETEASIRTRLENARQELDAWNKYDFLLINKILDQTVQDMLSLIDVMHKSTKRLEDSGFYEK